MHVYLVAKLVSIVNGIIFAIGEVIKNSEEGGYLIIEDMGYDFIPSVIHWFTCEKQTIKKEKPILQFCHYN